MTGALPRPLGPGGSYPRTQFKTQQGKEHRAKLWAYPDGGWELLAVRMEPEQQECTRLRNARSMPTLYMVPEVGRVITLTGWREGKCPALVLCDHLMQQAGNARRAATKARRLARFNGFRFMSTLTFPASVPPDRGTRVGLFQRWVRDRGGLALFSGAYLMFPEPHKKGSFHLHVLHAARMDAVQVRMRWTAFLRSEGFTLPRGTRQVRTHEKDWGKAREAARYAAKYVSKMFSANVRDRGRRRYYPSLGLSDGVTLWACDDLVTMGERFRHSCVCAWSASEDFVAWFYCASDSKPPDGADWLAWES